MDPRAGVENFCVKRPLGRVILFSLLCRVIEACVGVSIRHNNV